MLAREQTDRFACPSSGILAYSSRLRTFPISLLILAEGLWTGLGHWRGRSVAAQDKRAKQQEQEPKQEAKCRRRESRQSSHRQR